MTYAQKMGLVRVPNEKTPYIFNLDWISVLDIGCGPVSLLLKCINVDGTGIDPLAIPDWALARYAMAGIKFFQLKGENMSKAAHFNSTNSFDEVWIYNVLQHTDNPKKIIENAKKVGKLIRIFEWIDTPPNIGHPNMLKENELNEWLDGEGKTEVLGGIFHNNKAYYGVFPVK